LRERLSDKAGSELEWDGSKCEEPGTSLADHCPYSGWSQDAIGAWLSRWLSGHGPQQYPKR
jgi:hypothetical protein